MVMLEGAWVPIGGRAPCVGCRSISVLCEGCWCKGGVSESEYVVVCDEAAAVGTYCMLHV